MLNPFALAYWLFGGWAIEWARACGQATVHAMDDRHAHLSGEHARR